MGASLAALLTRAWVRGAARAGSADARCAACSAGLPRASSTRGPLTEFLPPRLQVSSPPGLVLTECPLVTLLLVMAPELNIL